MPNGFVALGGGRVPRRVGGVAAFVGGLDAMPVVGEWEG